MIFDAYVGPDGANKSEQNFMEEMLRDIEGQIMLEDVDGDGDTPFGEKLRLCWLLHRTKL